MTRAVGVLVAALLVSGGCGDNHESPALTPSELYTELRALPGVSVEQVGSAPAGYHQIVLSFTQPIDHDDPSQGTFQQRVSLLHRDERAPVPMVVHTSGYADRYGHRPVELTQLLAANQISIEHRYFGTSRPVPTDWTKLTIAQMAADEHEIIAALRTIYGGAFITTGGSKGGMTAVFHRRFYPDDVEGTVAYVSPISFGAPDPRYTPFLDGIGPANCRTAVRDLAVEMLQWRRRAIETRAAAQTGHSYTRILLGPAVEAAIASFEWTFWQYAGVEKCSTVPTRGASDDQVFSFLESVSPVSDSDDAQVAAFEAYFYQAFSQLGYPAGVGPYLQGFMLYKEEDYANELPPALPPAYDSNVMRDIDDFVEHRGDRLLFIYGGWDPWTAGKFVLGNATNSAMIIHHEGTHNTQISSLDAPDREVALDLLRDWTGVTPLVSRVQSAGPVHDAPPRRLPRVRLAP